MRFRPPRCPYPACVQHANPGVRFWIRHGSYLPRCRRRPVPRFRCRSCLRTFSRQTFRHDYRDRRPHCNADLLWELVNCTGLRQSARRLGLGVGSIQRKFRKIARTCRRLHRNLCPTLPAGRSFLLDEEESYEKASIRPLTVPILMDKETYFLVATMTGPIRRMAPVGTARRRRQDRDEANRGKRRDRSRACVRATLRSLRRRIGDGHLTLLTDRKASYRTLAMETFGSACTHLTTSSKRARDEFNPLFMINHTITMTRDNCGRLRRETWLNTEKRRCLQFHLHLFTIYRNYVRARTNKDPKTHTPAVLLGLLPRPLSMSEIVAWRQDWGPRSIHPISQTAARTVA